MRAHGRDAANYRRHGGPSLRGPNFSGHAPATHGNCVCRRDVLWSGGGGGGGKGGGNRAGGSVRTPYLRVVGVIADEAGGGRNAGTSFSAEEEARIKALAADPDIFERLASSVAPSIAGDYTDDIKRAILCLLLGGRWKALPDGGRLRGDINVLLLGDPSTAKSQFLKFVERVAPVGVYTSGKGSSAAGLTASVVKDARGEFSLAGGAMVLADGGVVCIVSCELGGWAWLIPKRYRFA